MIERFLNVTSVIQVSPLRGTIGTSLRVGSGTTFDASELVPPSTRAVRTTGILLFPTCPVGMLLYARVALYGAF